MILKILILTFGSRGDVQPYIALGKGLAASGHTVTVCTSSSFESLVTEQGLEYGYATNELLELMDSMEGREAMEEMTGVFGSIKMMIKLSSQWQAISRQLLADFWAAAQAADPDLIIIHPLGLGGVHIGEKLNVPVVMAVPAPLIVPTVEMPLLGLPNLKLGGWYNKMTFSLVELGYRAYNGAVNDFRRDSLGLAKAAGSPLALKTADGRPLLVLHCYSAHLSPRPTDWPDSAQITGYWFLDHKEDWSPPTELQAFLDDGSAPVYVGFGSMAGRKPQEVTDIVVESILRAGVRAILATGWGGLEVERLPDSILSITNAPHDWLFPRVAAVVHHGGAGTTGAGLRAGRPTIICPFIADQPFWGRCVFEQGVGPEPIPYKKLTVDKLTAAITAALNDEAMRGRAEVMGQAIRAEDGIGNAIWMIEQEMAAMTSRSLSERT